MVVLHFIQHPMTHVLKDPYVAENNACANRVCGVKLCATVVF